MSAKLIVPFDNNPASTSIKTTSYTIPAGKYARVQNLHGDLLIDTVPHYVVIQSFSRVLTVGAVMDFLKPTSDCNLVISTSTSTISNASNGCSATLGVYYIGTGVAGTGTTAVMSAAGSYLTQSPFYYTNESFTTTRINYIRPVMGSTNYNTVDTSLSNSGANLGIGGVGFATYRASGTVTHTGKCVKYSPNEFWVASGTVLDGVQYSVTEYNVIS